MLAKGKDVYGGAVGGKEVKDSAEECRGFCMGRRRSVEMSRACDNVPSGYDPVFHLVGQ